MLSCDVATAAPGAARAGLQLDRKGHILAELWLLVLDDAALLDTAPGTESALLEILDKHVIADDVTLERVSGWDQVGIEGPGAAGAIAPRSPAPGEFERDEEGRIWVAGGSLGPDGARVLGERAAIAELREVLGLPTLSGEDCEVLRIEAFQPAYRLDFSERSFPQEARLEGRVSFTKGCYIGQEIVARIESRGAVNRLLVKLRPEAPVAPGAEIRSQGNSVGQVTSAADSAATGPVALGYVKRSLAEPGTRLDVEGIAARVA